MNLFLTTTFYRSLVFHLFQILKQHAISYSSFRMRFRQYLFVFQCCSCFCFSRYILLWNKFQYFFVKYIKYFNALFLISFVLVSILKQYVMMFTAAGFRWTIALNWLSSVCLVIKAKCKGFLLNLNLEILSKYLFRIWFWK